MQRRVAFAGLVILGTAIAACGQVTPMTDSGGADAVGDTAGSDATVGPQPTLVPVSTTGHDRFFGVTFEPGGSFYATGVVADGTDAMTDFRTVVAKFTAAGVLDTSFGTNGFATQNLAVGTSGEVARGIAVQPTGNVVVAATVEHIGATDPRDRDVALARFTPAGMLDTTFGTNGVVILDLSTGEVAGTGYTADSVWGLSVYPDGRLVMGAAQKRTGGTDTDFAVVRLTADGARDTTFGTDGVASVDINNRSANARTVTVLGNGGVLGTGYMDDGGVVKPVVFKLNAMGQLDTTFGNGGIFAQQVLPAVTEAYAAVLQGDSIVTAGYGRAAGTESLDWISLRFTPAGTLDTTFGTGGHARLDVAGFNDNCRNLVLLPGDRILLVGGGRTSEMENDGVVGLLSSNGQPETTFGPGGLRRLDMGGMADMLWSAAVNPARTHVAIVGVRGVGTASGNDDAALLFMPVPQ